MRNHPLTPMTDSSLVRLMAGQSQLKVGLVTRETVGQGASAVAQAFDAARGKGEQALVVDALTDADLRVIGEAAASLTLITGGSGIALGLPEKFPPRRSASPCWPGCCVFRPTRSVDDPCRVVFGSDAWPDPHCDRGRSSDTQARSDSDCRRSLPGRGGPFLGAGPVGTSTTDLFQCRARRGEGRPATLGRERAGSLVEHFLAETALGLKAAGVRRLIVAGGETSGAVVGALAPDALFIGPEIDPGVPWTLTLGQTEPMALALKSGNFGAPDFFLKAWDLLP